VSGVGCQGSGGGDELLANARVRFEIANHESPNRPRSFTPAPDTRHPTPDPYILREAIGSTLTALRVGK
jgi:hypothetical protein